jgi:cytochrome P450
MPLGLAHLFRMLDAVKENRVLEHFRSTQMPKQGGQTSQVELLGDTLIITIDPKNVQTILALKFDDFELGPNRNEALRPLLGHGIFASDGTAWERSRALLRPSFVKNRVADMKVYEEHVSELIKLIPADGSAIDLQPLFFRMVGAASECHCVLMS